MFWSTAVFDNVGLRENKLSISDYSSQNVRPTAPQKLKLCYDGNTNKWHLFSVLNWARKRLNHINFYRGNI
jgi:hypothetical protein